MTACKGGRLLKTKDMKALDKMDNLDKAGLLCKLFPAELENLQNAIKRNATTSCKNETAFREGWYQRDFLPLNFGTRLAECTKGIDKNEPL